MVLCVFSHTESVIKVTDKQLLQSLVVGFFIVLGSRAAAEAAAARHEMRVSGLIMRTKVVASCASVIAKPQKQGFVRATLTFCFVLIGFSLVSAVWLVVFGCVGWWCWSSLVMCVGSRKDVQQSQWTLMCRDLPSPCYVCFGCGVVGCVGCVGLGGLGRRWSWVAGLW